MREGFWVYGLTFRGEEDGQGECGYRAEGQGAGDTPGLVKAAGEITEAVLSGEASGARNAALLGAGLILKASGRSLTLADGVDEAVRSLDSGAPRAVLDQLRDLAE